MIKAEDGRVHAEGTIPDLCSDMAIIVAMLKETVIEDFEEKGAPPQDADELSNQLLTQSYFIGIQRGREDHEKKRKEAGKK